MIKTKLYALAASALLTVSIASYANQAEPRAESAPAAVAPANSQNFLDPNYWMTSFTAPDALPAISNKLTFNAAHPSSWMSWIDPKTHKSRHMEFANPASYTQFMAPQFYMEFLNPNNLMAWIDPNSYQIMMDPQTMAHWMNPASYTHMVDPAMYQETMNPANYMIYMNPATYAQLMGSQTCDQSNPNASKGWFGWGC